MMWAGVGVAIVAMVASGTAMMLALEPVLVGGLILVAVGLVVAWLGGIMGSVESNNPVASEIDQVEDHDVHTGIAASNRVADGQAAGSAVRISREVEHRLARSTHVPIPRVASSAAVALVALAGWLVVSPWLLAYPFDPTAQNAILVQTGAAVVVAWCGLWLVQLGPSRAAAFFALAAGLLTVAAALTFRHDYAAIAVDQIGTGALIAVAAIATMS